MPAIARAAALTLAILACAGSSVDAQRLTRYQVAAGTALLLELRTPLDSATALVDDQVEAVLWSPVIQDGLELIPQGSVAIGKVRDVVRASEKTPAGSVTLVFTIVEHAATRSKATLNTQNVLLTAPVPDAPRGRFKKRPKPVDLSMKAGTTLVAMTAQPLVVWIPR